ncbi:MAG: hypothetical protein A2W93_15380 [Bacteroidetes bacterium GWF2_43_63]|nr:MAG: hypothetical protein A2W93_15380 [Bacteroidetes bacterium GWF2_43_63]HBG69426.1 hypothetical protein [Bacteroidales bacterium]HCB62045.1 hypothetical protein [Bacteroidales bacterium]
MKKINIICFIIVATVIWSCDIIRVPAYVKREFNEYHGAFNNGYDTIINTQGYYRYISDDRIPYYTFIMFFPDGTFLGLFSSKNNLENDFFEHLLYDDERNIKSFLKHYYWGCYFIHKDTIEAISINHVISLNQYYDGIAMDVFVIDNEQNLILIAEKSKNRKQDRFVSVSKNNISYPAKLTFIPLSKLPPSDCWIKNRRWFWKNTDAWKQYKRTY